MKILCFFFLIADRLETFSMADVTYNTASFPSLVNTLRRLSHIESLSTGALVFLDVDRPLRDLFSTTLYRRFGRRGSSESTFSIQRKRKRRADVMADVDRNRSKSTRNRQNSRSRRSTHRDIPRRIRFVEVGLKKSDYAARLQIAP